MSFYSEDAPAPAGLKTAEFVLRPLTVDHAGLDHAALMDSKEILRRWSSSDWPADDFAVADNRQDLAWHQREHEEGIAFTYTVLDPIENECLGCVYIKENNVPELAGSNHTAIVRFWVRQSHLGSGLDRRLLAALAAWFKDAWAFTRVYFHANEQDHHQVQLLNASPLPYRVTAAIPNRPGRYRFYG